MLTNNADEEFRISELKNIEERDVLKKEEQNMPDF